MTQHRVSGSKKAGLSGLLLLGFTVLATAEPLLLEVQDASPGVAQQIGQPIVTVRLKGESAKAFADYTQRHVGKPLEIRIDGRTVMKPVLREPILGGTIQISGDLTANEAKDIARRIASGAAVQVETVD